MERKIFYSWQSHVDEKINRHLIRDALGIACRDMVVPCVVDESTHGIPGSPPILDTILAKIDKAVVFVADMTLAKFQEGRHTCNPNVLVEYGYALARLGDAKILTIINRHFGKPNLLPFNVHHKNISVEFSLAPGSGSADIDDAKLSLAHDLGVQLCCLLEDPGSALSLSSDEARVVNYIISTDSSARQGRRWCVESLAGILSMNIGDMQEAVAELVSRHYLKESPIVNRNIVEACPQMYWDCDIFIHGWDARRDAKAIARQLIERDGYLQSESLSKELGWNCRRLNPALLYLMHGEIVKFSKMNVAHDFVTPYIWESEDTRGFLRGSFNPDERRRS